MIPGILIWCLPPAAHLQKSPGGPILGSTNARNDRARDMLGVEVMQVNNVVIFVDGRNYYVMKDKLDGKVNSEGLYAELPALMKYYEDTYNAN